MYAIFVDHSMRIIRAHLSGFFTEDDVMNFARDEQMAAESLRFTDGGFGLLVETSGGVLQSQTVAASFQRLFIELPIKARKLAIVSESALFKMQLRRIADGQRTCVFDDTEAALVWMLEGLGDSNVTGNRA